MVNEELDQKLLRIIKEQQGSKPRMAGPDDLRCMNLLNALKEGLTPLIDVFYVLNGAIDGKYWFVDAALGNPNTIYFEPHIFDYEGGKLSLHSGHSLNDVISVGKEELELDNFALIVDDSWKSGDTIRKTVAYLEDIGYKREKVFVFHYFGNGAYLSSREFNPEKSGFILYNQVLLTATTMLDFFDNPEKYQ